MTKMLNFRVSDEIYEKVDKASCGNKSAWLLEAVIQKLGIKTEDCNTSVLQRIEALEKAVFSSKEVKDSIPHDHSPSLKGANAARALEAKEKVKQAILDFPDATSNAELSRLSKLDRGTISKYREVVLQEMDSD